MFVTPAPRTEDLADGLVLRSVETRDDAERLAVFNGKMHSAEEAAVTRRLILAHPETRPEHWLIVEDPDRRRIVSTLCLIPWRFRLGDVELRSGEMGFVATNPDYQKRGLVRRLVGRHEELLREGGYDLSHIQGIAGFYGQFGYSYAVPLIPDLRIGIPAARRAAEDAPALEYRPATAEDAQLLEELYRKTVTAVDLSSRRSEAEWRYLIDGPSVGEGETWLFCRQGDRTPAGYFRVHKTGFGDGLIVSEVSLPGAWAAGALLGRLAEIATEWKRPYIKLEMDPECDLAILARDLGGQTVSSYAWQIRIVNLPEFLRKLGPLFEKRVANSMFAGLTERVVISTYRDSVRLVFEDGRLTAVDDPDSKDRTAVRVPGETLVPLLLGCRSLDELEAIHHDFGASASSRTLLRTLFPRMRSYFHIIY